ncbi:MAG: hypothetical protein IPG24_11235 [Leptospiraceae bacterium]|nr:hypothetical protein [Leptospiraceae bacterium]
MSLFTLFMFVLGLSASIYILISAMSRIIARRSNTEIEKKLDSIQNKIDELAKAGGIDSWKRLISY